MQDIKWCKNSLLSDQIWLLARRKWHYFICPNGCAQRHPMKEIWSRIKEARKAFISMKTSRTLELIRSLYDLFIPILKYFNLYKYIFKFALYLQNLDLISILKSDGNIWNILISTQITKKQELKRMHKQKELLFTIKMKKTRVQRSHNESETYDILWLILATRIL